MKSVLDLFFPKSCLICGEKTGIKGPLCEECAERLIAKPVKRSFNLGKRQIICRAPTEYEGEWKDAILRFKAEGNIWLAKQLSELMLSCVEPGFNTLAFVPMTRKKQKKRGYNQSELLAHELSKRTGLPVTYSILRTHEGEEQHTLSAEERRKNAADMFEPCESLWGKRVIVIDDIITTGATFCSCARAVLKAGAADVTGLCAASNPRRSSLSDGADSPDSADGGQGEEEE